MQGWDGRRFLRQVNMKRLVFERDKACQDTKVGTRMDRRVLYRLCDLFESDGRLTGTREVVWDAIFGYTATFNHDDRIAPYCDHSCRTLLDYLKMALVRCWVFFWSKRLYKMLSLYLNIYNFTYFASCL